ncbi:hypothetical protein WICPIJ_005507 [Wickerhamomyces pijperi]|uniref:Uncharacterized protein n=1 Tax=Wickerhamomyces pijperi TaxID=599730 RepID=A0A9P8TMA2_WICPI|nr:hypothetical protein WICPIJ_005507 [Wickerhamomyces pijperi]
MSEEPSLSQTTLGIQTVDLDVVIPQKPRLPSNGNNFVEFDDMRKKMATDLKTSTEYTLHILFTQFVRHSERKLNLCLQYRLSTEPPIVELLSEGIDPSFDKIIASLGHISKSNPKPVIDSVMFWRKSKSENSQQATEAVQTALTELKEYKETLNNKPDQKKQLSHSTSISRLSHKRSTSSKSSSLAPDSKLIELETNVQDLRDIAIKEERKSLISIYILCRVLIEVVKQVNFDNDSDDLGDKLEEIVFSQLRQTDPILISSSIIRSANWNLFAELLGYMSDKRFLSVSDRFIADLEKIPPNVPKNIEPSIHLLIHGMRYLKLRNYPLEDFEECADFLQSIAKFFKATNSHSIRVAYSQVLTYILLPLAESLSAEVNHPIWADSITSIFKACSSFNDASNKNWLTEFTLATSALCVAPNKLFLGNWMNLVDIAIKHIKGKNTTLEEKVTLSQCISRLLWVYIYRCTETLNNTTRKVESILKSLFMSGQKVKWLTSDPNLTSALIEIFKIIGFNNYNQVVENYLLPIFRQSFNGSNLDNIQHEKIILVVRSYVSILNGRKRPKFPETFDYDVLNFDVNADIRPTHHEEICRLTENLITLLDSQVGQPQAVLSSSSDQPAATPTSATSTNSFYGAAKSPFSGFGFRSDMSSQLQRSYNIELLAVIVEIAPWLVSISSMGNSRRLVEQLCRDSLHDDIRVANSSSLSLKLLVSKKHSQSVVTNFAKFAFDFNERSHGNSIYISKPLLRLYLEILEDWLESIQSTNSQSNEDDDDDDDFKFPRAKEETEEKIDELEIKNTTTVIEEVEGHGLFFLCSQDFEIRRLGLEILRITEKFDDALYAKTSKNVATQKHARSNSRFAADVGTRVIFILQSLDFSRLISSQKNHLSVAERSRLSKINQKHRKSIITRLAESDYGVDSALWFKVFPTLLSTIFERCPITMALCRSIVCSRLVQVHESILHISTDVASYQKINAIPAEVLVEQWKLYLIVACISLTSTTEQRISIPESSNNSKSKKHKQILTIQHSTITSAKSVFRLTLNLLRGNNPTVRDAIILGLSCMNINIFKTFVEAIDPVFEAWEKDISANRIYSDMNRKRIEITHILNLVSKFVDDEAIVFDDWILGKVVQYTSVLKIFLSLNEVQNSFEFQKLRRYFCGFLENVYVGLQKRPDASSWFPFESRVACFAYLEEWCGYGKSAVIAKDRYITMAKNIRSSQELTALNSAIEFERQIITVSSINTMAGLLRGPIQEIKNQTLLKFDLPALLSWIDLLLISGNDRIFALGKKALKNLFESNSDNEELFGESFKKLIHDHKLNVLGNYYTVVSTTLMKNTKTDLPLKKHKLLVLALLGVGSNNIEIRSSAIDLLIFAENRIFGTNYCTIFRERVKNKNKTIYKRALLDISSLLASSYPDENIFLISELTKHFHTVSFETRRDTLTILLPWLQTVELKFSEKTSADEFVDIDISSYMIITNLFEITMKFSESISNEIEALWIALGNGNNFNNVNIIISFLFHICLMKRSPLFVEIAGKVMVYLSINNTNVADILVSYIDHKNMVPPTTSIKSTPNDEVGLPYISDIWTSLNEPIKESVFSVGQLSLIFLSDLLATPKESFNVKIPLLLHVGFVLLDHYLPMVQEAAGKLIVDILNIIPSHPKLESTKDLVKNNQKLLWVYDDLNDKNGARSPKDMDLLVRNSLEIFSTSNVVNLQQDWGKIALFWATNCAVRHIACRSFQIFRSLLSFLDQSMLKDMLQRLSNTISDETSEIQGFSMQILMTLNAIVSELDAEKLIDFPQLFWSTVASLNTTNEHEYIELISILTKFLSKIDLDSEDTVSCLIGTFPTNWQGKFEGLQQVILIGLRSSASCDASLQLLDKINKLKDSDIIADENRLLFALLANIPRYLHALDSQDLPQDVLNSADILSEMAKRNNQPNLSHVINSFAKNRFRSKDDFLRQTVNFIASVYLNNHTGQIILFLLGLLSNKNDWVKIETMSVLNMLLPKIDLAQSQFQGCGADLISPLLRLLLTPYANKALEVLDKIDWISGSKLDKDILRMSLGNKSIKKDYDKTATLFGIPEESGWSIPMPAITSATTRNNVHAVFSTCLVPVVESVEGNDDQVEDQQIHFHSEDYPSLPVLDEISVVEDTEGSLSHMWAELDNLDSFFNKDREEMSQYSGNVGPNGHNRSISVETRFSSNDPNAPYESAPQIYDKKVSVILNRSLARTQSNNSFKTSLADSFGNSPVSDRHLSSITTSTGRDIAGRTRVTSPTNQTFTRNVSPTSPQVQLSRESSFRFEGVLAQATQKPKKRFNRKTLTSPEYLNNWSAVSQNTYNGFSGNSSSHTVNSQSNNVAVLTLDVTSRTSSPYAGFSDSYAMDRQANHSAGTAVTNISGSSGGKDEKFLKPKTSTFSLNREKRISYFGKAIHGNTTTTTTSPSPVHNNSVTGFNNGSASNMNLNVNANNNHGMINQNNGYTSYTNGISNGRISSHNSNHHSNN